MRRFLLTGASSGVGEALALRLAASVNAPIGLHLIGRNASRLKRVAQACQESSASGAHVTFSVTDIRDAAAVDHMWQGYVEEHGTIDVVVANAGINRPGLVEDTSVEQFDDVIATNVKGLYLPLRKVPPCPRTRACRRHTMHSSHSFPTNQVLPVMKAQRSGQIVVNSSVRGLRGGAGSGLYSASKFALRGLMKCVRLEVRPYNIKCGSVYPGGIDTPWHQEEARGGRAPGSVDTSAFLTANDVAEALLMLINQSAGSDIEDLVVEPTGWKSRSGMGNES